MSLTVQEWLGSVYASANMSLTVQECMCVRARECEYESNCASVHCAYASANMSLTVQEWLGSAGDSPREAARGTA